MERSGDDNSGAAGEAADFERVALPSLQAAFNLARWLTGNEDDAQDVVQESYLRARRFFPTYRGGSARAWMLTIVRNTCRTWMLRNNGPRSASADESEDALDQLAASTPAPDAALLRDADVAAVRAALEELSPSLREVIVLREMEGLSYREIAEVAGLPLGTVMSRLARARERLQLILTDRAREVRRAL